MGIFTRFKDIVSANLNAMLDHAEDPEKMIKLMIREMEETLVELKAGCAGSMADRKKVERQIEELRRRVETWDNRARLAVDKDRDDLAKEALVEKNRLLERLRVLEAELAGFDALVAQGQEDIARLEEKLTSAAEKKRLLLRRHAQADHSKRARQNVRRAEGEEAVLRFEQFEQRIERMEAEAGLAGPPRKPSLDEEFALLEEDGRIAEELAALKRTVKGA